MCFLGKDLIGWMEANSVCARGQPVVWGPVVRMRKSNFKSIHELFSKVGTGFSSLRGIKSSRDWLRYLFTGSNQISRSTEIRTPVLWFHLFGGSDALLNCRKMHGAYTENFGSNFRGFTPGLQIQNSWITVSTLQCLKHNVIWHIHVLTHLACIS